MPISFGSCCLTNSARCRYGIRRKRLSTAHWKKIRRSSRLILMPSSMRSADENTTASPPHGHSQKNRSMPSWQWVKLYCRTIQSSPIYFESQGDPCYHPCRDSIKPARCYRRQAGRELESAAAEERQDKRGEARMAAFDRMLQAAMRQTASFLEVSARPFPVICRERQMFLSARDDWRQMGKSRRQ